MRRPVTMLTGLREKSMKIRSELRLIERAINQGWQTPPNEQAKALETIFTAIDSDKSHIKVAGWRVLQALVRREGAIDSEIRKRANDALRRYQQQQI